MQEQPRQQISFYEMLAGIHTLEALLESLPHRTIRPGSSKLWRILWDDASGKIAAYLLRTSSVPSEGDMLEVLPLEEERIRLRRDIMKISQFNVEAGEALWRNSAAVYMVSANLRLFVQSLRTYLEHERRLMMPRKGAIQ
ncbi:MAG TPA: hypothetical protein VK470_03955 [Bacteroidota bacterium]|nr:hypothetical protein [Bacteroidota bacterium]